MRLRRLPSADGHGPRMHGGGAVADSPPTGDRIKTDRRDALALARLHRNGELTPVWVPDEEQEAMRDLERCREDMKHSERRVRQRLNSFLQRHSPFTRVAVAGRKRTSAGWNSAFRSSISADCLSGIASEKSYTSPPTAIVACCPAVRALFQGKA